MPKKNGAWRGGCFLPFCRRGFFHISSPLSSFLSALRPAMSQCFVKKRPIWNPLVRSIVGLTAPRYIAVLRNRCLIFLREDVCRCVTFSKTPLVERRYRNADARCYNYESLDRAQESGNARDIGIRAHKQGGGVLRRPNPFSTNDAGCIRLGMPPPAFWISPFSI